ncbi:hypothetical protein PG987_012992 [Apiospora arundinis]
MLIWAGATTLLAHLGAGLPIEPSVVGSAVEFASTENSGNASFLNPTMLMNASLPGLVPVNESFPQKIAERNDPPAPQWPFDVPGDAGYTNPTKYHCTPMAEPHNQIPPGGLLVGSHDENPDQIPAQPVIYSQQEIYSAFRMGASILWSAQNGIINFEDLQSEWNGERFPNEVYHPQGLGLNQVNIGLGVWHLKDRTPNRPREQQSTAVYQYPLVWGPGPWQQNNFHDPGPDRVLFQLVFGIPLYLGVISYRTPWPNPTPEQQRPSWGFPFTVNLRYDQGVIDTMRYPGISVPPTNGWLHTKVRSSVRSRVKKYKEGGWGSVYPPPSASPSPPGGGGGDPGTGAGAGGSGNMPVMGPGGISSGAGGDLGGSGAFHDNLQMFPQPGNVFLRKQPALIPGPSRVEL